ncbi:MAG: hypothetical protein IJH07_10090 [Ruminococcus sp.]|nr:hypothetical protein [Ruminococcus sp.]
MFENIVQQMARAEKALGTEKALEIAPVYLLPKKADSEQYMSFSLENLLLSLEKNGILFDKSNVLIPLSIESDSSSELNTGKLGFCTQSGVFKPTIERWILYYKIEYHAYQGVVAIDIRDYKEFLRDPLFASNLARQIISNKKRFLFFILFDEDGLDEVKKKIGEMLFTCTVETPSLSVDEYLKWVVADFHQCSLDLDSSAISRLKELVAKYLDRLDFRTLSLWMRRILWECASAEVFHKTIGADAISEETLMTGIARSASDAHEVKIGFS